MDKINVINSRAVCVPVENIDTDQIIPARFLKTTSREGFGERLFHDWRFHADGTANPDSVLAGQSGEIFVAGGNFGCGSSREHAAWALHDAGYKAVVSSSFADIFRNNALNNQLLPVQVTEPFLEQVFKILREDPGTVIVIDLPAQTVEVPGVGKEHFEINGYKKECLMKGYSDIDYLLADRTPVLAYEQKRKSNQNL